MMAGGGGHDYMEVGGRTNQEIESRMPEINLSAPTKHIEKLKV